MTNNLVLGSGEGDNASAVTDSGRMKRHISFDTELSGMGIKSETGLTKKWGADLDAELEVFVAILQYLIFYS